MDKRDSKELFDFESNHCIECGASIVSKWDLCTSCPSKIYCSHCGEIEMLDGATICQSCINEGHTEEEFDGIDPYCHKCVEADPNILGPEDIRWI